MKDIKKLMITLVALLALTTGAWAQSPWTSGDCTVTLSGDVMTVSGTGAMADYKDSYELPWYGYDIKTIVIESGVSSIGNSAFAKCYNLESVSIPASVTSIGMQAFENCGYDATALTVSFAEGSTPLTIGEYAFYYANLKSIDIPNRVTSIGNGAFTSCSKLESVSIPASVTSIGNFAFQSCGSYAEALTVSFAEGSTLESIGESTFLEAKLTSINIPNSVTSIGTFAFSGCSNLESVSIPASVTSIGYNAFSSCSKLESVSIPASVTSISEGAFRYCGMLAKVYIYAPSLTTYGANAFTSNAAGRKIYVLSDAVDTYKAGWPDYAADIVGDLQPLASGPEVAWNAATKTGTFTMPGDNVTVSVEYYDLATLADKGLTAAVDAAAKTEAPLAVLAENAITGGTVMYYVAPDANFSQADAIALAETAWSADIPTAETIDAAGGTCYVWYYIKGDDEHSDTDPQRLAVTVLPEPTYTVDFAEGTEESDKWTVKAGTDGSFQSLPLKGVKAGTKVKLKYDGDRSMLKGVKATSDAKPAATVKTITIAADFHTSGQIATAPEITIEYNEGEKWSDVAARYDWLKMYETYTVYYDADSKSGDLHTADGGVKPSDLVDPTKSYYWGYE